MKRKSLFLVSVALLLCACSPSNNNPIKDKKVLVCYGNDKSDAYFGSSVDEAIKSANKEKGNSVELVPLGLGVNGANYENLLDDKINSENFDYVILLG